MSVIAGEMTRSEDWVFVATMLCLFYIVIYPLYVVFSRYKHARRISKQLVTSAYKLPIPLTPTELAYIFTTKVGKKQLLATILDLANRSIFVLKSKEGVLFVEIGPKIESNLTMHEQILFDFVHNADGMIKLDHMLQGHTIKEYKKSRISGSRAYVYWWFLRQQLRDRKIIEKSMARRYSGMLLSFGMLVSLLITVVSVFSYRIIQMSLEGEVDFSHAFDHVVNGLQGWLILLIPTLLVSFIVLRFRGRMLGRQWILASNQLRYMNQIIAFREFVRLTHKKKLRFESKELEKHSTLQTKPYALALGYVDL